MPTAREMAELYLELGWVPIPVGFRSKNPGFEAWEQTTRETVQLPSFDGASNVGIVLLASGLADVDLDCAEAVKLAPRFLPRTMVFGRASSPASHWIYRVDKPLQRWLTFRALDKSMLCEIRGGVRQQTVFPGSVHVSGEPIEWVEDCPDSPALLDVRAIEKLAAACLLVRHWPARGRHEAQLALAGGLARGGWTKDDATTFLCAVCYGVGDEDPEKRKHTIEHTYERIEAGEPAWGWNHLGSLVGREVVKLARAWLGDEQRYSWSELGLAQRLADEGSLHWLPEEEQWISYVAPVWKRGRSYAAYQAGELVKKVLAENSTRLEDEDLEKLRKQWVKNLQLASMPERVLKAAATFIELKAFGSEFGAGDAQLATPSGVIDLRTGSIAGAQPSDRLVAMCQTVYVPGTLAPRWIRFLEETFLSEDERQYVQLAVGATLVGSLTQGLAFFCHGPTRSGKGTLVETLMHVLGPDLAVLSSPKMLRDDEMPSGHSEGLAVLAGKTMAVFDDVRAYDFGEDKVKNLTGGGLQSASRKGQLTFSFHKRFVPWMTSNHKPIIRGSDGAIWTRLRPILFTRSHLSDQDTELKQKLRREAEGILSWGVEGARLFLSDTQLLTDRKRLPQRVQDWMTEFEEESLPFAQWFDACVEIGEEFKETSTKLFESCSEYHRKHGLPKVRTHEFWAALSERGYPTERKGRAHVSLRCGLRLKRHPFTVLPGGKKGDE